MTGEELPKHEPHGEPRALATGLRHSPTLPARRKVIATSFLAGAKRPLLKRATTVCQILHSLGVGGAEVLAARLARQLAGEFRFLFVCLDDLGTLGQELRDQGFPVWVLGRRPGLDWRCSWQLANL